MGALLARLYDQLYSGKQLEVAVVGIEVRARGAKGRRASARGGLAA
jgi:hypothetical protein